MPGSIVLCATSVAMEQNDYLWRNFATGTGKARTEFVLPFRLTEPIPKVPILLVPQQKACRAAVIPHEKSSGEATM